jgi:hypothetical protein
MTKIIPIHTLITRKYQFVCIEEGLPLPDALTIFYNKYFDTYEICTLDELETRFRVLRNEFGHVIDEPTGDEDLDEELRQKYLFTHWTPAPVFSGEYWESE